jgi:hypothetical protein
MPVLVQFLLEQIGVPVVGMIIKEYQTAHNNTWPTPEQVAQTFIDDISKWTNQGNAWLLANPKV